MHYEAPEFYKDAFNCPHCNAYSRMVWSRLYSYKQNFEIKDIEVHAVRCEHCERHSIWEGVYLHTDLEYAEEANAENAKKSTQLFPYASTAPMPSPDLPEDCKGDFMEARDIFARSPRGSAALLRLVVQKLCKNLGMPGQNINDDIKMLVRERNLSEMVQQALDAIRVIGNNAVHPGELQLEDDAETAIVLFEMVNIIVDEMISKPNKAQALFDRLPAGAKAAIAKRDQPKP